MKFNLKQNENENVEWVSWSKDLKKVGDGFKMNLSKLVFKENDAPVFFVIDEDANVGISAYCTNHPDSKFQNATPHGIRLAGAISRHFELGSEVDSETLVETVNAAEGLTLQIDKTEKGVLWTIV